MTARGGKTRLLYQEDAYLRSNEAEVLYCSPVEGGHGAVLDRTVLYPEGGGQPADHGTLSGMEVLDLVRNDEGQLLHVVERPVSGKVEVLLDWARRYDHMQQHTAQHLLTAVALERNGLRTTAFHLGVERSDIELDTQDLTRERLTGIEEAVNERIRENLPVRHFWAEKSEFQSLGVRSRRIPAGHEGPVRLVEIQGVDLNTCGGTHVSRTGELQALKLLGTEKLRGGTRVYYVAGGRVMRRFELSLQREQELNRVLSCGPEAHAAVVQKLVDESQATRRALRRALLSAAEQTGRELAAQSGVPELHQPDGDMAFLQAVQRAVHNTRPDHWLFLTAGTHEGFFLIGGPAEPVRSVGPKVAGVLGGKGGGPPGVFQGKASQLNRREEALALIREAAGQNEGSRSV